MRTKSCHVRDVNAVGRVGPSALARGRPARQRTVRLWLTIKVRDCRLALPQSSGANVGELCVGFEDILTVVPSTLLLGLVFGAGAEAVGIGKGAALAMSAFVFSGSAQFAALPLWQASGTVIVLSALVLSLRFSFITAAVAPVWPALRPGCESHSPCASPMRTSPSRSAGAAGR
jgi:AzlC protein